MPYPSVPPPVPLVAPTLSPERTKSLTPIQPASDLKAGSTTNPLDLNTSTSSPQSPEPAASSTRAASLGPAVSIQTPPSQNYGVAPSLGPVGPTVESGTESPAAGSACQLSDSAAGVAQVRQHLREFGDAVVAADLTALQVKTPLKQPQGYIAQRIELTAQQPAPAPEVQLGDPLELSADRQEYDEDSQVFTATGNVVLRFQGAVLKADRVQANLQERTTIASGNVSLTRGQQLLTGERLEYNLAQDQGSFLNARGTIFLPSAQQDFSPQAQTNTLEPPLLSERLRQNQPSQVQTTGEEIQRLRFEAARIDFGPQGWTAEKIRITNDPFSPPELEVRAERARLQQISPLEDRVTATRPRVVFDQKLALPILKSKVTISRRESDPAVAEVGYDESDRGGFFVGRNFEPIATDSTFLTITPQFFFQRAITSGNFNIVDPDLYGVQSIFTSRLGPQTSVRGVVSLSSLDPSNFTDSLRADLTLRRAVGRNQLALGYTYRDRVFNGSLGEQTVQNRLGATFSSPSQIKLGNTGINLNYRAKAEFVTAKTDRLDLDSPTSLGRFQASAALSRGFYLWRGQPLPATATAGLKYTPAPVVPYLQLLTRIKGISNNYSNGDTQQTLVGTIGLQGQIGHFSRPTLDYTGFNISYSQVGQLGSSPFLFDRVVDFKTLTAGILQQIYGPLRLGFQTSLNLDTGELFDTDLILDYSRRTYGVVFRYSPTRDLASISFKINGFNWVGSEPFPEINRP